MTARRTVAELKATVEAEKITEDDLKGLDDRQIESQVTPTNLKAHMTDVLVAMGVDKVLARSGVRRKVPRQSC